MSGSNVACLIPDRDSDSSDDEFLDALDAIENEPELEYAENVNSDNNSVERHSIASSRSQTEVEVDGGSVTSPKSVTSSRSATSSHSAQSSSAPSTPSSRHGAPAQALPSGTELSTNREMPSKFDLNLELESDSLVSTPSHMLTPFRTPDMTPLKDGSRNDSFASARTTTMTPESDKGEDSSVNEVSEPTIAAPSPPPRPPQPSRPPQPPTPSRPPQPSQPSKPPQPSPKSKTPEISEEELLAMMTIKCLDTGQTVTMDKMEEILKDADPLSKHLTEVYGYAAEHESDSDNSSYIQGSRSTIATLDDEHGTNNPTDTPKSKTRMKNFAKKGMRGMKGMGKGVKNLSKSMRVHKKENESAAEWEVQSGDISVYPNSSYKNYKLENAKFNVIELQSINKAHVKAIWVMKMSPGGKVLASAGDDKNINIWVLKSVWDNFVEKYYLKNKHDTPPTRNSDDDGGYFESVPFRVFRGSEGPIIDLNWSKKMYFLLSAGTDRNVRLWHIARQIQIACFPHPDVVPTVVFHPLSDVLFLSGCLDGRVKLWNIHARKVQSHYKLEPRNNSDALITAVNFVTYGNRKVRAFVGTYDGRITVLDITASNTLDYHTALDIRGNRSKNARKITSIEQRPNSTNILVTSNDSRIRLYDVDNWQLTCKYKGFLNVSSQIKASFSHDGKIIISGDEKNFCYFWETETHYKIFSHASSKGPLKRQLRRDKNDCYHRFRSHESRVTCATFAPEALTDNEGFVKEIFVTSDAKGNIKCFLNIRNP